MNPLNPRALVALAMTAVLGCALGCSRSDNQSSGRELAAAGGGLRLQRVLGQTDAGELFARASPEVALRFPADHGPHPRFRSEWWYLTLMLADERGREYGGQFTLFRQALRPLEPLRSDNPWRTSQVYLAHLAMTDVSARRHRFAERISRAHPQLAGVTASPFAAWLEGWQLASVGEGFMPLVLNAATESFGWSLNLDSERPLIPQGDNGYSAKGPGQGSHYYSFTRLSASGTLETNGQTIAVTGSGWLDREWSTSVLSAGQIGWDWFALQLDDGRDLMLFRLRREDCQRDPFDHGVLVGADGDRRHLDSQQFTLTPRKNWQGPGHTALVPVEGCRSEGSAGQGPWPLEWQLTLDDERFTVRAALFDQRMQTSVQYWEGLVHVIDAHSDERLGRGYMELTGY